jgi:hypothetical protein
MHGKILKEIYMSSDMRTIKLFVAALMVFGVLTAGFLGVLGYFGYANTIEQSIMGVGDIYTRHDSEHMSDLASAKNSTFIYENKEVWGLIESPDTMASSFIINGATTEGGYRNQYVVKSSGAGYKHVYRATQISGDFSGSGEVVFTLGEDGSENIDSLILMDSRAGNATFQGRVYASEDGKPITKEEMDSVGRFMIRSYLNISKPILTPEGWLNFCETLDKDMILDKSVPDGFYISPPGYKLKDGKLVKDSTNNTI